MTLYNIYTELRTVLSCRLLVLQARPPYDWLQKKTTFVFDFDFVFSPVYVRGVLLARLLNLVTAISIQIYTWTLIMYLLEICRQFYRSIYVYIYHNVYFKVNLHFYK